MRAPILLPHKNQIPVGEAHAKLKLTFLPEVKNVRFRRKYMIFVWCLQYSTLVLESKVIILYSVIKFYNLKEYIKEKSVPKNALFFI